MNSNSESPGTRFLKRWTPPILALALLLRPAILLAGDAPVMDFSNRSDRVDADVRKNGRQRIGSDGDAPGRHGPRAIHGCGEACQLPQNVSPALLRQVAFDPLAEIDVVVAYTERPGQAEQSFVESLGGTIAYDLEVVGGLAVRLPAFRIELLAQDELIEMITLDAVIGGTMDVARVVTGLTDALQVETGLTGSGVSVAVVDSGIGFHPDADWWLRESWLADGHGQSLYAERADD